MLLAEIACALIAVAAAFLFPNLAARRFERIEGCFRQFAARRPVSVIFVGILAVLARLAVLPVVPIPYPAVHDEFSYLLMADTFAHGRLADPTPPMWVHFETFHVNMVPTYVSKFYPAQGFFLAIGQVAFGHPFWGVLLSSALMCAAICWMLQGWMSPAWALLGGVLAVIRFGMFSYWANSYWGGAVTALGGALVLGALPRIKRTQSVRDAMWLGLGAALLVNSRPYEAVFLMIPIAIALFIWTLGRNGPPVRVTLKRIVVPSGLLLALTLAGMMIYFWKTTGSPLRPPYVVNERTYYIAPPFPWLSVKPIPNYSAAALRNFFVNSQLEEYKLARFHPVLTFFSRAFVLNLFYLGPTLAVPILALAVAAPYGSGLGDLSQDVRFLLLIFGVVCAGMALPAYFAAHYAAELAGLILALVLISMRFLRTWRPSGKPIGTAIGRLVVVSAVLLVLIRTVAQPLGIPLTPARLKTWASQSYLLPERASIVRELNVISGKHLVIARDGSDANHFDWVYNGADIDGSKIVWARDLGPSKNQELIDYFKGREVWLVETERIPPKLSRYP